MPATELTAEVEAGRGVRRVWVRGTWFEGVGWWVGLGARVASLRGGQESVLAKRKTW